MHLLSRQAALFTSCLAGALVLIGCTGTSSSQVEVTAGEQTTSTTTTTTPADCAELLPPAAQASQMLMIMVTNPQLAGEPLANGLIGGFGLKGRQSSDVGDEVAGAIAESPLPAFVASDEEGGTVQRLGRALGSLPAAAELAEESPQEAAIEFGEYARLMAGIGFNMNFGPVADVGSGSDLGSRSFGDDPAEVARFTDAIINAQEQAGIISTVKHWPGIGGGATDPHLALDSLAPIEELRARDLLPFDAAIAAGASAIMVAHAEVPGLTAENEPASLSRAAITDELRGRQGFDGLVVTDSLGMGAIVNAIDQDTAAEQAITAGADLALLSGPELAQGAHDRLTDAIETGRIPTEQVIGSVRRILAAKGISGPCMDLVAIYSALRSPNGTDRSPDDGSGSGDGAGSIPDAGINDTSGSG